jgi:hypothetical protein
MSMWDKYYNITGLPNIRNAVTGSSAEHLVISKASYAGFIVSAPVIRDTKYDLIFDNNAGGIFKVQVKGIAKGSFSFTSSKRSGVQIPSNAINKTRPVTVEDAEICIGVHTTTAQIYLYPTIVLKTAGKYDVARKSSDLFRDAWHLLVDNQELNYEAKFLRTDFLESKTVTHLGQMRVNVGMKRYPKPPYIFSLGGLMRGKEVTRKEMMLLELWMFWIEKLGQTNRK